MPESESTCIAFDRDCVQRRLSTNPEAFLKFCHYGLIEAVIPLFIEGKISGAMFVGPFIWHSRTLPPSVLSAGKKIYNPLLESQKTALPKIDKETVKRIFALGNLISSHIENLILQSKDSVYEISSSRSEKIKAFIDARFKENISIGDLAKSLFLCESRTSQLLKKSFGKNFQGISDKAKEGFKKALKVYGKEGIKNCIDNIKESKHHIESKFKWATPSFVAKEDTMERYATQDSTSPETKVIDQDMVGYNHIMEQVRVNEERDRQDGK
jgi:hypothetical protein